MLCAGTQLKFGPVNISRQASPFDEPDRDSKIKGNEKIHNRISYFVFCLRSNLNLFIFDKLSHLKTNNLFSFNLSRI